MLFYVLALSIIVHVLYCILTSPSMPSLCNWVSNWITEKINLILYENNIFERFEIFFNSFEKSFWGYYRV